MHLKIKKQQGFTIIETMIVLAIAGLIMLIVFLAVPALERSARNTQRKNDAGNILTAVNNYVTNNNGLLPTDQQQLNEAICSIHLGFYAMPTSCNPASTTANATDGVIYQAPASPGAAATPPGPCTNYTCSAGQVTTSNIYFLPGNTCVDNSPSPGSSRGYAVYYMIESSSSTASAICTAS